MIAEVGVQFHMTSEYGGKTRKKKLQQERFCLFDSGTYVPLCDLGKLMFLAFQRHNARPFITLVFPLRALK